MSRPTQTINDSRISQVDVSVNGHDRYPNNQQAELEIVKASSRYLPMVHRMLERLDQKGDSFDLCLYNAGMDPSEHCSTGGLAGITSAILAERERVVFEWCADRQLPIAFVLAGGYIGKRLDIAELVALHRLTLEAASIASS